MQLRWSIAVAITLTGSVLLAQQSPVFRSQANYVEVDAIVTDGSGKFVPELTAADFEIREERQPQSISAFSYVELKGSSAPSAPVTFRPDTPQQARLDASRIYLLYFNAVPAKYIPHLRQAARDFVNSSIQPHDVAGIWDDDFGGDDVTITNDKNQLLRRIAGARGMPGGTAAGVTIQASGLKSAVDWLSAVQGRRKSLILFAAGWLPCGYDTTAMWSKGELERLIGRFSGDPERLWPNREAIKNSSICGSAGSGGGLTALLDLLPRSDIHIYTCDVRGLVAASADTQPFPVDSTSPYAGLVGEDLHSISESIENLRTIADVTGGLAIVNTNDYAKGFARIVEDNSRYYLLGYDSSSKPRSGEFRTLDVRMKRPGLTVRARKGYVAR